jgi:hypothetical protein
MIPRPEKTYSLSSVRLLGFQGAVVELEELGGQDTCVVLIPVLTDGSGKAKVEEPKTGRQEDIIFSTQSIIMVSGRCTLWIQEGSKVVCAMLCIGRDKASLRDVM